MGDGVALVAGDGQAPGGLGVGCGGGGEVAGQPRVDRAQAGQLAGPAGEAGQGGQRDGQGDPAGEPRGDRAGLAGPGAGWAGASGAGVGAQEQVQVGPGADLVRPAVQPGRAQLARPPGDPVTDRQHLVRRQLPARQRGVPGILGPPLHPREPRRGLPPLPRLVRGGLHHRAGDRGAQAARGQPPGPVQHPGLGGAGLVRVHQGGGVRDDPGLAQAHDAIGQRRGRAGQMGVQVTRGTQQLTGAEPGLPQRARHLIRGELRILGLGVTPVQLGDRGQLARGGVGLDPVPRAHQADQLGLGDPGEPVVFRGGVGGDRQLRAAGQHVEDHPRAERGRRAGRLAGEHPRRAGLTRAAPAGGGRPDREQLIGGRLADLGELLPGERGVVLVISSSSGGSSCSRARSSQVSRSGSRSSQARSSSHPGSAGTGSGGMEHHPFGMMISIEHSSVNRS